MFLGWKPSVGWSAKWLHRGRSNNTVLGTADDLQHGSRQQLLAMAMNFEQAKSATLAG
jgi:hypothetical protein